MQQVTVRVPASTSNLGPGFDCLGVALKIYNRVTVTHSGSSPLEPIVDKAARLFFKQTATRPFRFSCAIEGDIPRSRGLGSSAAVRLGVLHALNCLAGDPLDRLSIFLLAAELEGHPDNAAPENFGGFTVARDKTVQRFAVSPRLRFVLLIPDLEIKTSAARRILPSRVPFGDVVKNSGNACAITAAFASGEYRNLQGSFADHLHQPYRRKLIPFLPRVIAAAEKAGALGAFLSGSGSTIAAVTLNAPKKVAAAMLHASRSSPARTMTVSADNEGVRYIKHRTLSIKPRRGPAH